MAQHVYHWKHGWIPLTHTAALSKAKGNKTLAARYVADAHSPSAGIHSRQHVAKALVGLPSVPTEGRSDAARQVKTAAHKHGATDLLPGRITGKWQATKPEHDGTPAGVRAAANVKQAFRLDKHTVHIETDMTPEQTQALLADVKAGLGKFGSSKPVTVRVPKADAHFRSKKSITGGYVHQGTSTVVLNPRVADGSLDAPTKGKLNGQLMPAIDKVGFRQYTIVHELGHVNDHHASHTHGAGLSSLGRPMPHKLTTDAEALFKVHRGEMSKYGATNATEAYAEAYAQWHLGGPGTSAVADAYARKYGWT